MRTPGPTVHSIRALLVAITLCVMPLLTSAQTEAPDAARAPAEASPSPPSTPSARKPTPHRTSLMGMVMAALIESAEESARQHRAAAHHAAAPDVAQPRGNTGEAVRTDPAWAEQREETIRKQQVAVQADESP